MEPVLAGLAVLGVLLGSAAVGTCMVLCAREHWEGTSARIRRFTRHDSDSPRDLGLTQLERARRDSNP